MKKLMILGSAKYFENLVLSAKQDNIYTIVCDNRVGGPAKQVCDEAIEIDIFDLEKLKKLAIEKEIDGIITSFSDILMKPYAYIANELGLPCVIKYEQLGDVTNKMLMKDIFEKSNIPSINYCVVSDVGELNKVNKLKFPVVMKPLDSSGSKGIYFVNDIEEVKEHFNETQEFSTDNTILFEEFYESEEIQGFAWVHNGEAHVMYIGDRELVNIHEGRPGKPDRLIYPSKYCYQYGEEIKKIYQQIVDAFKIENGPLYVQLLVGVDGVKVSEMMTRLPGGCDYLAVKQITGFDAGRLTVNFSVGNDIDFEEVKKYGMRLDKIPYALPIYIRSGVIGEIKNIDKIENLQYVSQYLLNVSVGDEISASGDARQDCGRVYGVANNLFDANKKKKYIHSLIEILDENGESMIENF